MSTTTYTVFHGGNLHGTGSYSGPGLDIIQALRDATECASTVGGEPEVVADDTGRHVRFVDGLGWVEMPEEYDAADVTAADCQQDCQLRIVAEDGEELEDDEEDEGVDAEDCCIACGFPADGSCGHGSCDAPCHTQDRSEWYRPNDAEEEEDGEDSAPSGWVDTSNPAVAIYWENGEPCTVSVTGDPIDEKSLVSLLCEETGLDVSLVGTSGDWNPGEGDDEAVRGIVVEVEEGN